MGVKDVRGRAKREREFYSRANLQQCSQCGRWMCRREDSICSRDCLAKLEASEKKANAS
jgi:hypothetical protein